MKENDFLTQGTLDHTYGSTTSYTIDKELYPNAFSVGYVKEENMPKQFLPTYYRATYTPTIDAERVGEKYPNTTNDIYDIFYMGYNSNSATTMNGAGVFETNGLAYCNQNSTKVRKTIGAKTYLYGKFNPLMATRPSRIQIVIRFCGTVSGSSDYTTGLWQIWWLGALSIQQLYDVIHGTTDYTYTHANMELKLSDFIDKRYITRNDSNAIGVYSLSYSFEGWGRNSDGTGAYSYVFPSIGYLYGDLSETYEQAVTLKPDFSVVGGYGSAPYGAYARDGWGGGFRVRTAGGASYPTLYQEDGLQIYQAALNGSYASFDNRGYAYNASGFICCAPVMPTSNTVMYNWDNSTITSYLEKLTDDQSVIFTPQGRTDFAAMHQCASLKDIWKHAGLFPVWSDYDNRQAAAQLNEHFWFAEMNGDEFLCNLIRGDDPSLQDKVPEWILDGDSTLNEYDPETDRPAGGDGGDDDPSANPNDPGKREDKIVGDRTGSGGAARIIPQTGVQYYVMTGQELLSLRSLVWAQTKDFYSALNIINTEGTDTIFNYISSLRYYPFPDLTNFLTVSSTYEKVVLGTGATIQNTAVTPYTDFNLRTVNSKGFQVPLCYWNLSNLPWRNNFLDFTPYSKLVVTIPYCGDVELDLNRVAAFNSLSETRLYLLACGDIDSGTVTFNLFSGATSDNVYEQILYSKNVKIAIDLPLSGNDQITQSNAILQATYNQASKALSVGSSLIGEGVSSVKKGLSKQLGVGDVAKFATDAVQGVMDVGLASAEASLAKRQVPINIGDINGTISTTQTRQYPYLTLYRQKTANPANYGHTTGFTCEAAYTLSQLSGFTVLSNPDLSMVQGATQEELSELMGILTTGFYI